MNSQSNNLWKAVFISPFSVIGSVILCVIALKIYILITADSTYIEYFGVNGVFFLIAMLIALVTAFIGVLIFMLPTYYISQKFNLTTYKTYVSVGGLVGFLFGLPSLLNPFSFLPALFFMFCGIVVSFTFWYIAVKRL